MELIVYLELFALGRQNLTTHFGIGPLYSLIGVDKLLTVIIRLDPA